MNPCKPATMCGHVSLTVAALMVSASLLLAQTNIPVPNGDFSDPANAGSIGGLFNPDPDPAGPLGSGPWSARTEGIDLLGTEIAAPTVAITSGPLGHLSFSGLAVDNVIGLGLTATEAEAFVTTTTGFLANSFYTLTFDFDSTSILSADLLSDLGFGVSLTAGGTSTTPGTFVANSADDPLLLNLSILGGGDSGTGTLTFLTGDIAPIGDIGVRFAFGESGGTLNAGALSDINIDNVQLAVTPVPEPGSLLLFVLGMLGLFRRSKRLSEN